jgi:molecular chaperone IbpA
LDGVGRQAEGARAASAGDRQSARVLDAIQRTGEGDYPLQHRKDRRESLPDFDSSGGFTPDEVALTVEQNVLTPRRSKAESEEKLFLHRGISG